MFIWGFISLLNFPPVATYVHCTHLLWRKFKSQKILYNFWHWFLALFTKPIKNWGVPEMIYCKFLPWSKNCRWNRVKMVKNVPKMAEIILGTSHMIDNKIFNIFSFFNFFLWILFRPCFLEFFLKILTNYRGSTVPKRKRWKTKKVKMSLFIMYEAPKIISSIFCPFLTIFTLFHLQFLLYSKNLLSK